MKSPGKDSVPAEIWLADSRQDWSAVYIYADAGEGESSTDLIFAASQSDCQKIGRTILAQSKRFENEIVTADLDIHRIRAERRRMTTYPTTQKEYEWTEFETENGRDKTGENVCTDAVRSAE